MNLGIQIFQQFFQRVVMDCVEPLILFPGFSHQPCAERTDSNDLVNPAISREYAHLFMKRRFILAEFPHISQDRYPAAAPFLQYIERGFH